MIDDAVKKAARDFLARQTLAAVQLFGECVKPIYGVDATGSPEHLGSAILLDLPEGRFLLTAAHLIDDNIKNNTTLYVGSNTTRELAIIDGEAFVTSAPNNVRADDKVDFAMLKVVGVLADALANDPAILESQITQAVVPSVGRVYTCVGFPNSKNRITGFAGKKITPKRGIYSSVGRPAAAMPNWADDSIHNLVDYDAKWSRDESGNRAKTMAMIGFSGGAIIDVGAGGIQDVQSPPSAQLAALLIEGHAKEKVIIGTRICVILSAVRAKKLI